MTMFKILIGLLLVAIILMAIAIWRIIATWPRPDDPDETQDDFHLSMQRWADVQEARNK